MRALLSMESGHGDGCVVEINDRALVGQCPVQQRRVDLTDRPPVTNAERGGRPSALSHRHARRHDARRAESGAVRAENQSVRHGLAYLVSTQAADGTWHVRARAVPLQPTTRSGFAYSRDSWISAAGSSWAAIALSSALQERPIEISAR